MVNREYFALGSRPNKIRELFEYGKRRISVVGEENVFDYSIGNPSIPAPDCVNETAHFLLHHMDSKALHGYTSSVGDLEARQAIAEDLNQRFHAGAKADNLFITCGAAPALTVALRALSVRDGQVMVVAPYFGEYEVFIRFAGEKMVVVPADIPIFQIDFHAMERLLNKNVQAVILNSPNNPAGTVYTEQTLRRIGELLTRKSREFGHPIYIISDEPYRELVYDGVQVPFVPAVYPNTVICYSYSKSLSLPGERLGYVYVPDSAEDSRDLYLAVAGAARATGHVCAPSIWQKMIARCAHERPDLASYDKNRRTLYEGLTEIGYQIAKPDGAFYLFVKAPDGDADGFCERAKKLDLLVVPGSGFGCDSYFRLCYAVSHEMILRSLPLFRKLMDEYQK